MKNSFPMENGSQRAAKRDVIGKKTFFKVHSKNFFQSFCYHANFIFIQINDVFQVLRFFKCLNFFGASAMNFVLHQYCVAVSQIIADPNMAVAYNRIQLLIWKRLLENQSVSFIRIVFSGLILSLKLCLRIVRLMHIDKSYVIS